MFESTQTSTPPSAQSHIPTGHKAASPPRPQQFEPQAHTCLCGKDRSAIFVIQPSIEAHSAQHRGPGPQDFGFSDLRAP